MRKEILWPKNLTYKAIYHPDTDRMVEALKIVLEMPTGNERESKELFPPEQKEALLKCRNMAQRKSKVS